MFTTAVLDAGADIDALGFIFLRTAVSSILTDVQYDGLPTDQVRLSTVTN